MATHERGDAAAVTWIGVPRFYVVSGREVT